MNALLRAVLAGAATGSRSTAALAALTLTAPADAMAQPDKALATPAAKVAAGLAAAGEFTADKLPQAPGRLELPGLGSRLAAGAAAGVVIARRDQADQPPADSPALAQELANLSVATTASLAAAAAAAALASAWLCYQGRSLAASRIGALPAAFAEDALALGLAWAAAQPQSG